MSTNRAPRTAAVILYQGDDYEKLAEAMNKLRIARRDAADDGVHDEPQRGGDKPPVQLAEENYETVLKGVLERATEARVRGIGGQRWRELVNQHKPRDGDEHDAKAGYDRDTLPLAVVEACLVEPDLHSTARAEWIEDLTLGETQALFEAALGLNENKPVDPKVLALVVSSDATGG